MSLHTRHCLHIRDLRHVRNTTLLTARLRANLNQVDAAKLAGVATRTYCRWETGEGAINPAREKMIVTAIMASIPESAGPCVVCGFQPCGCCILDPKGAVTSTADIKRLARENALNCAAYSATWTKYMIYRHLSPRDVWEWVEELRLYKDHVATLKAHWPVRDALTAAIDSQARKLGLRYPRDAADERVIRLLPGGKDPSILCNDPHGYWAPNSGDRPTTYTIESAEDWRY